MYWSGILTGRSIITEKFSLRFLPNSFAFASFHLEDTFRQLKEKAVTLHGEKFIYDADDPKTRWAWILPQYAHGVLIEVMDEYKQGEGG